VKQHVTRARYVKQHVTRARYVKQHVTRARRKNAEVKVSKSGEKVDKGLAYGLALTFFKKILRG
jgi:hypothetical protein